jgi:hypothetical protein
MAHGAAEGTASRELSPGARRVAAAAVAGAAIGWWPAFTLGVYGVIFFEQKMALWAAASSAFLGAGLATGGRFWRRPAAWALLLPSLWLLLIWLLPVTGSSPLQDFLFYFGIVLTLVGMPMMAALLVRLLIRDADQLPMGQLAVAASIVGLVMLISYGLGTQHPRLLSCDDFSISGNFAPDNCTPGPASAIR